MEALYTATAKATGGRNGHVETLDGLLKFDLSVPKGMGGPGLAGATNPEQLFASGYAACFAGAVGLVAKQMNHALKTITITADVTIGKEIGDGFGLAVELKAYLPEVSHAQAREILEAAHEVCPYSKATRNNIDVKLTVVDKI